MQQYKEAATSGGEFHQVPAAVYKDGVRQFGHPMSGQWAIDHLARILADPTVQAYALAGGAKLIHILAYLSFVDETEVGVNISAAPMSMSQGHTSQKHIHGSFSTAAAVVAYFPIAPSAPPPGVTAAEHTERCCAMRARATHLVRCF